MLTSSAKSKGRRLQYWTCQKISEITGFPWGTSGQDKPIESRPMGQHGADVRMEDAVRAVFPFSVECKNQESWSIFQWIEQAKENCLAGTDWLLVLKKNKIPPVVVLDAECFFKLVQKAIKREEKSEQA
jgi:hypothetical protein